MDDRRPKDAKEKSNVLMLASDLHHSAVLFKNVFERLPGMNLTIVAPDKVHSSLFNDLDLLIAVRNLFGAFAAIIAECRSRGIPVAYAVDDNLVEIGRAIPEYRDYCSPSAMETLAGFDWILCSNDRLLRYYRRLACDEKRVLLVPATIPLGEIRERANVSRECLTLAYFGSLGPHQKALLRLAPVLREISDRRRTLRIVSAGIDLNPMGVPSVWIPFTPNYPRALAAIDRFRPEILLCPYSSEDRSGVNLAYKNPVKLFDALRLGAVLAASKVGPYRDLGEEHGVVAVENDLELWKNALLRLIDDGETRQKLFSAAREYVAANCETGLIVNQLGRQLACRLGLPGRPAGAG